MEHREYPKWKYHPDREPELCEDKDSETALGHGWLDSPIALGGENHPAKKPDAVIPKRKPQPQGK